MRLVIQRSEIVGFDGVLSVSVICCEGYGCDESDFVGFVVQFVHYIAV